MLKLTIRPDRLPHFLDSITQRLLDFQFEKLKFPFLIAISLRTGLSLWIGIIWLVVDRYHPSEPELVRGVYGQLTIPGNLLARALLHVWVRWDAVHFLNIAKVGYSNLGLGDYNFFPLFPWVIRVITLNGLFDLTFGALLVTTISVFLALIIFRELALDVFQDNRLANWTILAWAIYPTSFFLFAPFSDALFALFCLGCLFALRRQQWLVSGLLAILAGLTRGQGILLVVPIGIQFVISSFDRRSLNLRGLTAAAMATLGGLAYILWRTRWAGMLFAGYARDSRRSIVDPLTAFLHALRQAVTFNPWHASMDVLSILVFGLIIIYAFQVPRIRKETALLSYTIVTFSSFLPWYSEVVSSYQSSTRYVLSLYPAFLVIAYILVNKFPRSQKFYVTASLTLMLLASAGYALWIFVG